MWTWLKGVRRNLGYRGAAGRAAGRDRLKRRRRPGLEGLESRVVPASIVSVSHTDPSMISDTAAGNVVGPASVSADGRFVVYSDTAANLAPGQVMAPLSSYNVFLYDRALATTTLVSHAAGSSALTANGTSKNPVISADGNWVAFVSNSDNLLGTETVPAGVQTLHDQYWVFLYHRTDGSLRLVSHQASDQGAGFQSTLASGSSGQIPSVAFTNATNTTSVSISGDGHYLAYVSTAAHLLNGQQPATSSSGVTATPANVFVYDAATDTNYLVSAKSGSTTNSAGAPNAPGNDTAFSAAIDVNGDTVAYTSLANNLMAGETDPNSTATEQHYVTKRTGVTWASFGTALMSHSSASVTTASTFTATDFNDYPAPVLTPDGHYVAYVSVNDDIVAPAASSGVVGENVYVCDTSTLSNTLVSHKTNNATTASNAGIPANFVTTGPAPAISDDGRFVAFVSDGTNLTSPAASAGYNTYLFDRLGTVDATHNNIKLISHQSLATSQLTPTSYPPLAPSLSGDGRYLAYVGFATADISGLTNANTLPGSRGMDALLYDQGPNPGISTPQYGLLSHSYASATTTGTGQAYTPVVSHDGSTVLYLDDSDNLLPTTINGHTGQDLNAALPTDGTDLYAFSLNTPAGYTAPAANGTNATVTLADPGLPSLNANGLSEIAPAHAVSDDGRFVVYSSVSPNTVAGEKDATLTQNIFLYDKTTQKSTLVSHVAGLPTTTANGLSANAVISGDGSTVVFYSYATNMVSGETFSGTAGKDPELYLYDNNPAHGSTYGTVVLISHVSTSETQAANGTLPATPNGLGASSFASTLLYSNPLLALGLALPSVSANGQYIAYLSNATNLSDTNSGANKINVFLYDRTQDTNKLVSHQSGVATTGNGDASTVAISADGSTVAFTSNATNLLPTSISNGGNDELYVWSRIDNTNGPTGLAEAQLVLASHAAGAPTTAAGFTGTSGTSSWGPLPASLSADGAYVAYYFGGNNLVAGQGGTASPQNVFVFVVKSNFNALLSHANGSIATAGNNPANANLYEASGPVISADGRYVAYANNSTNLLTTTLTGQNGRDNVYLFDGAQPDPTKQNVLVSHADGQVNTPDSGGGTAPYLSANGSTVSFVDLALDSNPDPMAIEPAASARVFATAAPPGAPTTVVGGVFDPSPLIIVGATLAPTYLSADGTTLVWDGPASDVAPVPGDRNSNIDVFLAVSPQPPAHLTITGGNNQNITVGQGPGTALTVSVSDVNNNPVGGVTVTFTINGNTTTGASGTFNTGPQTTATAVTDSNGNATVPGFTANTHTGGWTITASTPGTTGLLTATFNLTNVPDKPANITVTGGTPQSTVVGHAFPNPMTVQLTDQYNNPEPTGVNVTFTIGTSTTGASGTFPGGGTSITVQTDTTGTATVPTVTANTKTGTYTLTGTTPGVTQTATFTLTNTPDVPFAITASSGTPQTTTVNTTFSNPLQAKVTDQYGNTEGSGITVTFTAPTTGPSGTFNGTTTVTTDSNGIATSPTITANTTAGSYTVTATTSGVSTPASFSLTNTPDKPATITAIAGTPQSATVNTAFGTALEAKVTDQFGNAEPSVTVTFAAPSSGASGTFGGATSVTTDSNGDATAPTFTANTTAGSYTVTAHTAGVSPDAPFSLTNKPDKPAGFIVKDGSPQSATVNTGFGKPLEVEVVDQYGNAVGGGVTVTFTAPGSGPSGTFTSGGLSAQVTTDSNGDATAPAFTANTVAGSYTVTASTSGVGTNASFNLTNTPDKPAQISAILGTPQSATVNTAFGTALEAKVTDQFGNAEPSVTVTFAAPSSGASGTFGGATSVTTDSNGDATAPTFTANTTAGSYTVTASTSGVSPDASFSLTNTPDKPASIVVTDGSPQSAVVANTFAKPLTVTVVDQYGNAEPAGITVSFAAPGSGASGTFSNGTGSMDVTTASDGTATSSAFTANTVAGSYAVTASVTGAKPGTFSLTNTPGPASSISVDSGSGQSATVGSAFGSGLTILLTDQYGNPEQTAYTVTFTINAGTNGASGTFSGGGTSALVQTNSSGTATSPTVIANTVAGTFTVTATVSGVNGSATFQLTNNPGPTSNIIVVSGSPQSTTVNTAFGAALEVKLTDQYGNPEPAGITVTFTANPVGGASGTFPGGAGSAQVTTASDGTATAPAFTANTVAGSYTVTPSVTGVSSSASFALTNTADAAAALVVVAGSPQSAQVTTAFGTAPEVKVTDQYGNAEGGGITVTFTAPGSGPSGTFAGGGTSAQVTTASDGTATAPAFTANTVAGGYAVTAASAGIKPDASFSLTNTPGSAAHITVLSGSPQSAYIDQLYTTPLEVTVTDAHGNPVAPGTSVTFTAPASGPSGTFKGSGTSAVVGTDAKGNATAPDFTANAIAGPFTVTATVAGVSTPAAFSLQNLPVDTSIVYVNPDWAGTPPGSDPDGSGPATVFGPGGNAFATLDDANANVKPGGTIVIEGGTYSGPVDVNNAGLIILAGDVTLDTGGSSIDFKPPIVGQTPGADSLTINAGGGDVTFEKPIGDPALDNLTINGAHNVTFESTLDLTGNLTETGGTGTTLLGGGVVGGAVSVTAANITLGPGTLKAGSVTLDASGAVNVPTGASILATGNVVLDGGFNNPAGGSVTLGGVVTGASVSLLGGPGPDTFTITKDSGPITVDGEGGANQLNVDTSAISPGQILIVTAQTISDNGLGGPITYKANGGTFGHGVNVTTGPGNDIAVVESTQAGAPTFINTGNGDDSLYVSSSTNLAAGVISGLAGPLTLDAGAGKNGLVVSEAAATTADTVFITSAAIGTKNAPNAIWYKATGGGFAGVIFIGGSGNDGFVVLSTFPGTPTTVYGNGGNDTFNVGATPSTAYQSLTLDGGAGVDTLGVYDVAGGAAVNQFPSGPGIGQVTVKYASGKPSSVSYQNMDQVGSNVSQDQSFIQALYQTELGFAASPSDINFWLNVLHGPGGRQAVVDGIDRSQPALTRLTASWYRTYLGRSPANGEEQALVARLQAGETEESVLASLLSSDEYVRLAGGSDSGFVQRLFAQLLGRPATPDEVSGYVGALIPQVGRNGAAWLVLTSAEHRRLAVAADYAQTLHRTGLSLSDLDYWATGPLDLLSIHESLEQTPDFLSANG